jgi:hypothetical protein
MKQKLLHEGSVQGLAKRFDCGIHERQQIGGINGLVLYGPNPFEDCVITFDLGEECGAKETATS